MPYEGWGHYRFFCDTFWRCNVLIRLTLYFLCDSELSYLIVNYNISLYQVCSIQ